MCASLSPIDLKANFCGPALETASEAYVGSVFNGDKVTRFEESISESTALVFRSTDGEDTVKIYQGNDAGLAEFEYYSLKFLQEKGERVSPPKDPPQHRVDPDPFVEGALRSKGFSTKNPTILKKKFVPGTPFFKARMTDEEKATANRDRNRMRGYFKNGEFRSWLSARGIDPEQLGMPKSMVENSDIDLKDFILSENGWVLVDP